MVPVVLALPIPGNLPPLQVALDAGSSVGMGHFDRLHASQSSLGEPNAAGQGSALPVSVPPISTRRRGSVTIASSEDDSSSDDDDAVAPSPDMHLPVQSVATQQPPAVVAAPPSAVVVQQPPDAEQLSPSSPLPVASVAPTVAPTVAPVVANTEEEITPVSKPTTLLAKVNMIKSALGLDDALDLSAAIKKANEMMGLPPQGSLPSQAHVLLQEIGV